MSFIFRNEKTPAGDLSIVTPSSDLTYEERTHQKSVIFFGTFELLLENKRMFDRSIRDIERKKQGLQAEEEKLIAEMEKKVVAKEKRRGEVKQGGKIVSSCKSHDKRSYQNKHQITKFYALNHSSKVYLLEFRWSVCFVADSSGARLCAVAPFGRWLKWCCPPAYSWG
ncbi:unnamed protein product [Musa hybrid cultivar]